MKRAYGKLQAMGEAKVLPQISQMLANRKTAPEIAAALGVKAHNVYYLIQKHGIKASLENNGNGRNKMKIVPGVRDDTIRSEKEIAGVRITWPKWHEDARAAHKSGVPLGDLAAKYGVSPQRIYQIIAPEWEAYMLRGREDPKNRKPMGHYIELVRKSREGEHRDKIAPELREQSTKQIPTEGDPMKRMFEVTRHPETGHNALRIKCGKCGKAHLYHKPGIVSHEHAAKKFKQRGWGIGSGPSADRCPDCLSGVGNYQKVIEAMAEIPAAAPLEPVMAPEREAAPQTVDAALVQTVAKEIAAAMSREDRRLINAKLHEVYDAEFYKDDWSDEKVATDMGVNVAWVRQLREENFGENEFDPKLTKVNVILPKFDELRKDMERHRAAYENEIESLRKYFKAVETKLTSRMEQEVAPLSKRLADLQIEVEGMRR